MTEPRWEVAELWRTLNREIHERLRSAFRDYPLPIVAMILLRQIHLGPGVTVNELARRSGLVKSHVSRLVDQLVRQGFVEKRPDPDDQRLQRLHIRDSAQESLRQMEARALSVWSAVLDAVPDGELEAVARGLRILVAALERR